MDKFSPILVTLSLKLLLTATTNKNLRSHFSIPCKDKPNQQLKMMLFAYLLKNTLRIYKFLIQQTHTNLHKLIVSC